MLESFGNNLLWLVFGTSFSVAFGLLIAVLADRSRFERVAKSLIFLPIADAIDSRHSKVKRARFAADPPYLSVRRFVPEYRNCMLR